MADCRISCILKPHLLSSHEHITHVGNPPTWIWPREQVVASIEAGTNTFFVLDTVSARRAEVDVVHEHGKAPYLRTRADGFWSDNLLALNQCPTG